MTRSIERAKLKKVFDALITLPKERVYRILLRSVTFQPVGLITKRDYLNDSSIGRSRDWAVGMTFDGQIFKEPLDMINQRTNQVKSCIIIENGFFIITARKSNDVSDAEDNFQWFATPDQMNTWQELNDLVKTKDSIINSQTETLDNLTVEKERYYNETVRLGSHNRNLITQTQRLSEQISTLNTKVNLMETQVTKTAELKTELEARLMESYKSAAERGKTKAMSQEDIVDEALERSAKREERLMAHSASGDINKLHEIRERLVSIETKLDQKGAAAPVAVETK